MESKLNAMNLKNIEILQQLNMISKHCLSLYHPQSANCMKGVCQDLTFLSSSIPKQQMRQPSIGTTARAPRHLKNFASQQKLLRISTLNSILHFENHDSIDKILQSNYEQLNLNKSKTF